ncbi:MAG: alpha/beta hydrolase [Clostridia bacterium]|nr:alpha/beta hydrolase [Clostridia bacterium]
MFLHGYLSSGKSFYYQTEFFKKEFNVYAPDLKGFGENKGMDHPYSLTDYANDVKAYIAENGLNRPHVVAHSFGARIAVKMASEDPDVFDKMVLTGAAGLKPKRTFKFYVKRTVYKALKPFFGKERLSKFFSKDYNALPSVMKESFVKIINEHTDGLLSAIKNPTLLVFGENDKETPLYMAERFNKGIPNSELLVLHGAGHFAFIDKPLKFNTEVREFFLSR